jgi:hypothetical protein
MLLCRGGFSMMDTSDIQFLLKDKRVEEEIHKHLWIESQKVGYSIGLERAADEWLQSYAMLWMKHHEPAMYEGLVKEKRKKRQVSEKKKTAVKRK